MKQIAKILIIISFLATFIPSTFAMPTDACLGEPRCGPGDIYDCATGGFCSDNGGEEGSCENGANNPPACTNVNNNGGGGIITANPSLKSKLFVLTENATNITQTSATLHGKGGDSISNRTLPITAYFRYSTIPISPVFCNDIYGTNMISTNDIKLDIVSSRTFYQPIINLNPNTTYYYCAIVSNKENIAYGGSSIVKQFHTNCNETTIETSPATNIRSDSATLKGTYCSIKNVKTSFKYRELWDGITTPDDWKKIGETNHIVGTNSNVYGSISFNLSGLDPITKKSRLTPNKNYEFRAVAETSTENPEGSLFDFKTSPVTGSGGGGGSKNDGGGTGTGGTGGTGSGGNGGTGGTGSGGTGGSGSGGGIYGGGNGGTGGTNGGGSGGTGGGNSGNGNNGGGGNGGIINTTPLSLGQKITPPSDAIVRFHEGIETVFTRQIMADSEFAKKYGYQDGANLQNFAWNLSDQLARSFGYVNQNGREIRVSLPDRAAYQLQLIGNKLTVYEYYDNTIIDIRNLTTVFKNASSYEYYFKK